MPAAKACRSSIFRAMTRVSSSRIRQATRNFSVLSFPSPCPAAIRSRVGDGGRPYIRDGYDCYATPMEPDRLLAGYLDTYFD